MKLKINVFLLFFVFNVQLCIAQGILFGNLMLDEFHRRNILNDSSKNQFSHMLRFNTGLTKRQMDQKLSNDSTKSSFYISELPIFYNSRFDLKRPYDYAENGLIPARGFQFSINSGFVLKYRSFNLQIQPELIFSENKAFQGFPSSYSPDVVSSRFFSWNIGDNPERFGNSVYYKLFLGQSNVSFKFGSFEIGLGTRNYWWGPGQWNSLIFSNNAPGFTNVSLNTHRPVKSFLGNFEGQVLIGRLESSGLGPSQSDSLNKKFFVPLNSDWRYLNGLLLIYNPKWIPNLNFGFARTFQYYNNSRPKDFFGWLPVFEPMAKINLLKNGSPLDYDNRGQSQQISIFTNYKFLKARAEIYFQFGRRDHSYNWREFILNPEHARAFQFGFLKLNEVPVANKQLQIRGEITHQQESVNRILRYNLFGFYSWHTHGQVRGFTNFGQPLGVGLGTGSNIQTLEVSLVNDWTKLGILFERLENNQDFYYRTFGQQKERKPWIDWSTAFVWNSSWKNLFISTKIQGVYAMNYQWQLSEKSSSEFPVSKNLFSIHSQFNIIYFLDRVLGK